MEKSIIEFLWVTKRVDVWELLRDATRLMILMDFIDDIRATLLYFDLFDHPLSKEELYTYFPRKVPRTEFDRLLLRNGISPVDGFFHIRGNNEVVTIRKEREKKARLMLLASRLVGKLVGYFPFVRGVALSGSLSKGVSDGRADIDLFIITSEKRLWICRSFLTAFKKIFLFDSKKFLCPNYFVTENHLEIPERNIFTATELATLRPLFNKRKLYELLDANRWILNFFPNFDIKSVGEQKTQSSLQRLFELPMKDGNSSEWEERLMFYYKGVWARRYPTYTYLQRASLFRTTPYSSKVHPKDFQTKVLGEYQERLRNEKLERVIEIDD